MNVESWRTSTGIGGLVRPPRRGAALPPPRHQPARRGRRTADAGRAICLLLLKVPLRDLVTDSITIVVASLAGGVCAWGVKCFAASPPACPWARLGAARQETWPSASNVEFGGAAARSGRGKPRAAAGRRCRGRLAHRHAQSRRCGRLCPVPVGQSAAPGRDRCDLPPG